MNALIENMIIKRHICFPDDEKMLQLFLDLYGQNFRMITFHEICFFNSLTQTSKAYSTQFVVNY